DGFRGRRRGVVVSAIVEDIEERAGAPRGSGQQDEEGESWHLRNLLSMVIGAGVIGAGVIGAGVTGTAAPPPCSAPHTTTSAHFPLCRTSRASGSAAHTCSTSCASKPEASSTPPGLRTRSRSPAWI